MPAMMQQLFELPNVLYPVIIVSSPKDWVFGRNVHTEPI